MAAPTKPAVVKKALANPEPSTHGPKRRKTMSAPMSAIRVLTGLVLLTLSLVVHDPEQTLVI
jgi:hypothetical protein